MMTDRLSRTIGLVGSRAYEVQASRALGARALEDAVWETPDLPAGLEPAQKPMLRQPMLRRFYDAAGMIFGWRRND